MSSAYGADAIAEYAHLVGLPDNVRPSVPVSLELLRTLFFHQITTIPYENLSLHYNAAHKNSIDPQALFEKMVRQKRGRGGYCMEVAIFFWHILRSFGFNVYLTGVRIRARPNGVPDGLHIGWKHLINIITLPDGNLWTADVAFGGDGPTQPLKLEDGYTLTNLGTQQVRLRRDFIPEQTSRLPHQKLWIYEYRNASDKPWNAFYNFAEMEFMQVDFHGINFEVSQMPESFQRHIVLCIKFLRDETEPKVSGKIMLVDNRVKINMGGRTSLLEELHSEEQRVQALAKHFGLYLTMEEAAGISGWHMEIQASSQT